MTRLPLTIGRAWALSFALLLAQALGLHHAVAHGTAALQVPVGWVHGPASGLLPSAVDKVHHQEAEETAPLAAPTGAFHADHAAGDAQCRLVDQLGHAELLWLSLPTNPVVPADRPAPTAAARACPPDAARAPYQARGPP